MRNPVCSCGHGFEHHRDGRAECHADGCACLRLRLRPAPLPGVYDLGWARRLLRARTGRPLLERVEAPPRRSSMSRDDF